MTKSVGIEPDGTGAVIGLFGGAIIGGIGFAAVGWALIPAVVAGEFVAFSGMVVGNEAEGLARRTYTYFQTQQTNDQAQQMGDQLANEMDRFEKLSEDFRDIAEDHKNVAAENIAKLEPQLKTLKEVGEQLWATEETQSENVKSQKQTAETLIKAANKVASAINPALEQKLLEQSQEVADLKSELEVCRQQLREKDKTLNFALVISDNYQKKSVADDEEKERLKNEVAFLRRREEELLRLLANNGIKV